MTSRTSPDEFIPPYTTHARDGWWWFPPFIFFFFFFPFLFPVVFINFFFFGLFLRLIWPSCWSPGTDRTVGGRRRSKKEEGMKRGGGSSSSLTRRPFSRRRVGYQVEEKRHTHTHTHTYREFLLALSSFSSWKQQIILAFFASSPSGKWSSRFYFFHHFCRAIRATLCA